MSDQPNDIYQEPVFSRKVIEMLTVANEYCLYIEKVEEYKKQDVLEYLQKLIPIVYLKLSLLPDVEVSDESAAEHFVTEEQWENIFLSLRDKLGEQDVYNRIRNDFNNSDIVKASISENLADIYQDMKDFVLLYQKPFKASQENAVKDCKFLFETRTGYRLLDALSAIHIILFPESEKDHFSDIELF